MSEREKAERDFDRFLDKKHYDQRLRAMLAIHLGAVDEACELTADQKAKLTLAGDGDMQEFWERVAAVREKYVLAWGDPDRRSKVWPGVYELVQEAESTFFTESSLFYRSTPGTLDVVQRQKYLEAQRKRRRYQYEARLGLGIARLELGMPLRNDQRRRLTELLLADPDPAEGRSEDDLTMVLNAVSRLSEPQLSSLLDEVQLRALQRARPKTID